ALSGVLYRGHDGIRRGYVGCHLQLPHIDARFSAMIDNPYTIEIITYQTNCFQREGGLHFCQVYQDIIRRSAVARVLMQNIDKGLLRWKRVNQFHLIQFPVARYQQSRPVHLICRHSLMDYSLSNFTSGGSSSTISGNRPLSLSQKKLSFSSSLAVDTSPIIHSAETG